MRALTLLEPWATLVALGIKTVETRGRDVGLRVDEEFAVHAGRKRIDPTLFNDVVRWAGRESIEPQYGRIVAVATVAAVEDSDGGTPLAWVSELHGEERAAAHTRELRLGDFRPGRVLYQLRSVARILRPPYARGMQGVWPLPRELEQELRTASRTGRKWG